MKAQQIIDEMAIGREVSDYWWHGTTGENGQKIVANGCIEPANVKPKRGLAPMENRTYLGSFPEALRYAAFRQPRGKELAVVQVASADLQEFGPDEDALADILQHFGIAFFEGTRVTGNLRVSDWFKPNKDWLKIGSELRYRGFLSGRNEGLWRKCLLDGDYEHFTHLAKAILRRLKPADPVLAELNAVADTMGHMGKVKVTAVWFLPCAAVMPDGQYKSYKPLSMEEFMKVARREVPA